MRPLPTVSGVIHPAPPQTSKRGEYGKSDLYGILISLPTAGKTVGCAVCAKTSRTQKKSTKSHLARKTGNQPFVLLIRVQAFFHFWPFGYSHTPANASKFRNLNSANGHSNPLERLKRTNPREKPLPLANRRKASAVYVSL